MSLFSDALHQQLSLLEKLKSLLQSELELISQREPEKLMAVVKEKQQTLNDIQAHDQTVTATYSPELMEEPDTASLAETAKALLEECKKLTKVNAIAVEQGQLRLQHLRSVLIETRARESMTYDSSGRAHSGMLGAGIKA